MKKPQPVTKEDRLAEALRANLRRRKMPKEKRDDGAPNVDQAKM